MLGYFFLTIILLLPLQFALNIGENFDLVTTRVLVPALFLLWLARGLACKRIWIPNRAEMWLVLFFLSLSLLSLFLGQDAAAGFRKLLYFFSIFPVFFVAADIFGNEKWRRRGTAAIAVSGTLAAAIALFQFALPFFTGIGKAVKIWENIAPFFLGSSFGKLVAANSSWLVNIGGKTLMRAFGFFPDPHNFAFFASLCLFVALGLLLRAKRSNPGIASVSRQGGIPRNDKMGLNLFPLVGALMMLIAVVLSFSRGAYLGFIAGLVFFAVVFVKRSNISGKIVAGAVAVLALVVIFNLNIISQRLASSFDLREGSNAERFRNWTQAVDIVRDYPLSGVGLGNYARTVEPMAPDRSSIYAHNLFLDIAAETGALNAIVFLLLLIVPIWRNMKRRDMLGLGIAAGLVGFLTHSMFDTALYSPQVLVLLLVVVAFGMCHCEERSDEAISTPTRKHGVASLRSQ